MDINFEFYKVFYYVGKTLSFSEAANQLFITQSAVSQAIKTLEQKMHCKLFFRSTKQVKLTKEGEILFQFVEQAYNFLKSGEKNVLEIHSMEKGEVRIGASDTICKYYLLPYFKRFHKLYPQIKIHVINRPSPRCIDLLQQGQVDFAVVNIPNKNLQASMKVTPFREIEDILIGNKQYEYLTQKNNSLKELIEEVPILLLEKKSTTREFFDVILKDLNLEVKPEVELGSVDLLIELTKIGIGISFVMKDCIQEEIQNQELFVIPTEERWEKRYVGIVQYKSIPLSVAATKFVELLEEDSTISAK